MRVEFAFIGTNLSAIVKKVPHAQARGTFFIGERCPLPWTDAVCMIWHKQRERARDAGAEPLSYRGSLIIYWFTWHGCIDRCDACRCEKSQWRLAWLQ
jgi:hypothetical protein